MVQLLRLLVAPLPLFAKDPVGDGVAPGAAHVDVASDASFFCHSRSQDLQWISGAGDTSYSLKALQQFDWGQSCSGHVLIRTRVPVEAIL